MSSKMTAHYARKLIEAAVSGRDGFGIHRLSAAAIPKWIISEAWSPERKKQIRDQATTEGFHLVDHLVIGDYDLALWHTTKLDGYQHAYMVSINNAEHDPNDEETQKTPFKTSTRLPMRAIKSKLVEWVRDYGTLIVGSVLAERNQLYLAMVRKMLPGYKIEPYYGGNFAYGFKITNES
jgi:hypothetical protein